MAFVQEHECLILQTITYVDERAYKLFSGRARVLVYVFVCTQTKDLRVCVCVSDSHLRLKYPYFRSVLLFSHVCVSEIKMFINEQHQENVFCCVLLSSIMTRFIWLYCMCFRSKQRVSLC